MHRLLGENAVIGPLHCENSYLERPGVVEADRIQLIASYHGVDGVPADEVALFAETMAPVCSPDCRRYDDYVDMIDAATSGEGLALGWWSFVGRHAAEGLQTDWGGQPESIFCKTHNALMTVHTHLAINLQVTSGATCIVRSSLDAAASSADFMGTGLD